MVEFLMQISPVQWGATILSLVYIAYAVRNNPICWIFGILGCGLWAYVDLTELNLKFDALLQIFYIVMGVLGLYRWKYGDQGKDLAVRNYPLHWHFIILITGCAFSFILAFLAEQYLDTDLVYLDAITTSFSIVATILLVNRILENWLYWIVFNGIYIYIYLQQGAYLFVIIMLIYIIMAFAGYYQWRKVLAPDRSRDLSG